MSYFTYFFARQSLSHVQDLLVSGLRGSESMQLQGKYFYVTNL